MDLSHLPHMTEQDIIDQYMDGYIEYLQSPQAGVALPGKELDPSSPAFQMGLANANGLVRVLNPQIRTLRFRVVIK